MLRHIHSAATLPRRAVVLGAGFIGGASARRLRAAGVPVLALASKELDLLAEMASDRLSKLLQPDDTLIIVSARAPVKSNAMLIDNIRMMDAILTGLATTAVGHVVYVSSDAVYADSDRELTELSRAQPASLHGVMHLAREVMLTNAWGGALSILRPTLVYGADDPHNGYGPNRFRRLAERGDDIVLFGDGEERRDHVMVDDVAEILCRVVLHKSVGTLNVASGEVASFRQIAEATAELFDRRVTIRTIPRVGPMPHGGYRPFDVRATRQAFPDFRYTRIAEGLRRAAGATASVEPHG
jgi:UDP-glucose 4-epimerase